MGGRADKSKTRPATRRIFRRGTPPTSSLVTKTSRSFSIWLTPLRTTHLDTVMTMEFFVASETNTVTLSTAGTDGKVIADSIAFVKVPDQAAK